MGNISEERVRRNDFLKNNRIWEPQNDIFQITK